MAENEILAIQQKFAAEAAKRPVGLAQYQELSQSGNERLRHLVDDVWADHAALDAQKSPIGPEHTPKFLIAGAGLGGMVCAVRLIKQGFSADQIRLVETAGGVGGTWYWNRYPGLHCDVESYVYLPLLEEMGYMPTQKYVSGVEIRNYIKSVVKKFDLEDKILFRTHLNRLDWDETAKVWTAETTTMRGPKGSEPTTISTKAEFVILTAGLLTRPQIPKLGGVGLEGFKGPLFHTSLWDYETTGGSSEEAFPELSKLKGKKVGILGTGATAIQAIPVLSKYVDELYVFQRTPSAVNERGQKPTDPTEWADTIASHPGWQHERKLNFAQHIARSAPPGAPNMVNDGWTHAPAYAALIGDPENAFTPPEKIPDIMKYYTEMDAEASARVRKRVADIVKDKETAKNLTPWYPTWCKRPCFSDTYLPAFNQPNVFLVDTDGKGVDSVTPQGLVFGGKEYPVDILVLSTGYTTPAHDGGDPSVRASVKVYGKDGKDLSEKWKEQGATTLFGIASNGYPNLFWLGPSQAGASANFSHCLDTQAEQIAYVVAAGHEKSGGLTKSGVAIEVEAPAEEQWSMRCVQGAARFAVMTVCTPSYLNPVGTTQQPRGDPQEMLKMARRSPWSSGFPSFMTELEKWRGEGKLSGIQVQAA